MKDDKLQKVEALAKTIVRKYFCESDMDFMISTFADDIVWIGGGEYQKAAGREAVTASFLKGKDEMIPFRMWDEHYECVKVGEGSYLCSSDSMMEADPSTGSHMKVRQRCTFVFRETEDGFETVHIHNSIPFSEIDEEELFPVKTAREAYERLQALSLRQDRQLDLVLNQLSGGMVICSVEPPYHIEWMSSNFADLLGYGSYTDFIRRTENSCKVFVEPEDFEKVSGQVSAQLAEGNSYNIEYRITTRNGETLWVSEMGRRLVEAGNREVLYSVILNITEKKMQDLKLQKVTQEIRQNVNFLTQLYETIPCGIIQFTADGQHRLLNANREAWEIYGYTEEEYKKEIITPFQLVREEDRRGLEEYVDHMTLNSGSVCYTREARRRDGSICYINVNMERLLNAEGQDVIQAIYTDVTEMKELQLRQEQEQILENRSLRAAIWTVYQAIISLNLTENTYNCLMEQNLNMGFKKEGSCDEFFDSVSSGILELQKQEFWEHFGRERLLQTFSEGREAINLEIRQEQCEEQHWLSIQAIHVENPYGSDVIAIVLIRVLDQERAQKARQEQLLKDALAKAQKANQAKSDFLSRISHDIRTPMNAIIGMSAIGRHHTADPRKMEECLDKIDSSSQYLLSLLNDVLDMSRIESGKLKLNCKEFEFQELTCSLRDMIRPQVDAKKQQFELHCSDEVYGTYCGDYLRLHQILMNLLVNAVKFTPQRGTILVDIRNTGPCEERQMLEFLVEDTGIGMSKDFLERLYQPFEQESMDQARNMTGTGLGLSIVSNLVRQMDGLIEVESEPGKGTIFRVRIPLKRIEQKKHQELPERSGGSPTIARIRVLLAEDNELNREIAKSILEMREITVETAVDGLEAVAQFRDQPEMWYDAILMDIRMPGMDGLEATRKIRSMDREDAKTVPIIAMTANAFDTDREKAMEAGIDEYLIKPLDIDQMFQVLGRLKRHRPLRK